jgi:alkanesulfonate monooxygenase SsuD/methylene tetrahydromethanopterin reductase-like flavin-dependent oxidoreductase (luciferase family)
MARRGARTTEYLHVLRTLWTDEISEFEGEFYTVPRGSALPKPVQPAGPPVIMGGMAKAALERIGRLADGWVTSSRTDLTRIAEGIAVVKTAAEQAGRDPGQLRFICRGVVRAGAPVSGQDSQRLLLSGSQQQIRDDAAWLGEQGVTELFYDLNWDPQIGSPTADPSAATDRATDLLEALAPKESA